MVYSVHSADYLKEVAAIGDNCIDYATFYDSELVDTTASFVDYGFFSFKEKDEAQVVGVFEPWAAN